MDKKTNPLPGSVAAAMARGVPQHKALASVGLDAVKSVKVPGAK